MPALSQAFSASAGSRAAAEPSEKNKIEII